MARQRKELNELPVRKGTDLGALIDFIENLAKDIPKKEWMKLPTDWSEHLDEYASGERKIPA